MRQQQLSTELCSKARYAHDARFDGRFFIAVRTTGIYCRPVCRVRTPREENVCYYPCAAAAEAAGFRPCLKCRPERAPEHAQWRGASDLVARGLRLLEQPDQERATGPMIAGALGLSRRQVDRLFVSQLGATPAAIVRTRRLLLAKQLISDSTLSLTQVAMAAGYGSVRRFNAHFSEVYGFPPGELRRKPAGTSEPGIHLQLGYRPPYDWQARLRFLAARSLDAIEAVDGDAYRSRVRIGDQSVTVRVEPVPDAPALRVSLDAVPAGQLLSFVRRLRRALDLDADPAAIAGQFRDDPLLAERLESCPGIRLPAALNPFEVAVRAVVGQQVSVQAARTIMARLLERHAIRSNEPAPHWMFPQPDQLATARLDGLGLTGRRIETLRAVSRAVRDGELPLDGSATLDAFVAEFCRLPGIGDWTAQYVALRGLAEPDAFPAGDLVLRQRAGGGVALSEKALRERAECWRPWRAYAAVLLWEHPAQPAAQPERSRR